MAKVFRRRQPGGEGGTRPVGLRLPGHPVEIVHEEAVEKHRLVPRRIATSLTKVQRIRVIVIVRPPMSSQCVC